MNKFWNLYATSNAKHDMLLAKRSSIWSTMGLYILISLSGALKACDQATPKETSTTHKAKQNPEAPKAPEQSTSHTPQKAIPAQKATPAFQSFADLVEDARPSVINIYTRTRTRAQRAHPLLPFVPADRVGESLGSGVIIHNSGLALTNHHVIANATDIEVRLLDDRRFKAKIVGDDPKTDVALLKIISPVKLPALPMGDSEKLRVGEWVVAIGNPLGLTSTVTAGIASAVGRKDVPLGGELRYKDFIQTDASINPGNSGGPLVNTKGQIIGINTAINADAQGIGFAIPINMVKKILPELKKHGRVQRSWLGIYIGEVPQKLRAQLRLKKGGALVTGVVRGGPAERAQLQPGDIITKIDNVKVEDASKLSWMAGHKGVGKIISLDLWRGDKEMKTTLKLGALPD